MYLGTRYGFAIYQEFDIHYAHLLIDPYGGRAVATRYAGYLEAPKFEALRAEIDRTTPGRMRLRILGVRVLLYGWCCARRLAMRAVRAGRAVGSIAWRALRAVFRAPRPLGAALSRISSARPMAAQPLVDLIPNLYCMQLSLSSEGGTVQIRVLVNQLLGKGTLELLRTIGAIARVKIEATTTPEGFEAVRNEVERARPDARVVVGRRLYWLRYPLVPGRPARDHVIFL